MSENEEEQLNTELMLKMMLELLRSVINVEE